MLMTSSKQLRLMDSIQLQEIQLLEIQLLVIQCGFGFLRRRVWRIECGEMSKCDGEQQAQQIFWWSVIRATERVY